jgi:hypothetical protein
MLYGGVRFFASGNKSVFSFFSKVILMAYTVFFKERNQVFNAESFIKEQPVSHRQLLNKIAGELSINGATTDPKASKNSKGEWTILITDNGEVHIYTMYISKFEIPEKQVSRTSEGDAIKKTLAIIDPGGPRDSVGGYHPGYWSVDQYAESLPETYRADFAQTVHQIKHNILSENYSVEENGTIAIHIKRKDKLSIVEVECRARWV